MEARAVAWSLVPLRIMLPETVCPGVLQWPVPQTINPCSSNIAAVIRTATTTVRRRRICPRTRPTSNGQAHQILVIPVELHVQCRTVIISATARRILGQQYFRRWAALRRPHLLPVTLRHRPVLAIRTRGATLTRNCRPTRATQCPAALVISRTVEMTSSPPRPPPALRYLPSSWTLLVFLTVCHSLTLPVCLHRKRMQLPRTL